MAANLLKLKQIPTLHTCTLHTTLPNNAKAAQFMKKIMKGPTKKKTYSDAPTLPTPDSFSQGSHEGRHSTNSKRSTVLNKLFMKHITELMATGEHAHLFLGSGIEINRVRIAPDFAGLNVYWAARAADDRVARLLQRNAGYLRHELSTLRLMGVVPMIHFVRDRQHAQALELDARLARADCGAGSAPPPEARLKRELELVAPLAAAVRERVARLVEEQEAAPLPAMRQDVLGLDRGDVLARVQKAVVRAQGAHRAPQAAGVNERPVDLGTDAERREAFREFLRQRELLRARMRKSEKNYVPDAEYLMEEMRERSEGHFERMDVFDRQDEDETDEFGLK